MGLGVGFSDMPGFIAAWFRRDSASSSGADFMMLVHPVALSHREAYQLRESVVLREC